MRPRPWPVVVAVVFAGSLVASACGSSHSSPPAGSPGAITVPAVSTPGQPALGAAVLTVKTTDGTVGYRSVGTGPPLVLIMGAGTIDTWPPGFIDALATHFRVITADNAGIGMTSSLPAPLSVSAMAEQTSAMMTALHLGSADVLGWSLGGMIAQALAILHPAQVAKLVLCATLPGDGHDTLPAPGVAAKLNSPNLAVTLSLLFPADQQAAQSDFVNGVLSWPGSYTAPPGAAKAQAPAIAAWTLQAGPVGSRLSSVAAPTLVADGADDQLVPEANDAHLAATIPHAQLVIYPDASLAFLFQDQTAFTARVAAFLG